MTQIEAPQIVESLELEDDEIYVSDFIDKNPGLATKETAGLLDVALPSGGAAAAAAKSLLEHHRSLQFEEAYKVTSGSRGRCLIISNRTFRKKEHEERIGTDTDCSNLQNLFDKLGYTVVVRKNRSASDILGDCSMFLLNSDFERLHSCVLCILSHGYLDCIIGSDSEPVKEKNILDLFDNPLCKLKGKPKLVILQACRIKMKKSAFKQFCIGSNTSDTGNEGPATGGVNELIKFLRDQIKLDDVKIQAEAVPRDDLLIAYSTIPGALSWKNPNSGSWFVQAIVQVFAERCATEHVADMMVMVSRVVREASYNIQIPHAANRLYKKFYFFP